MEHLLTGALISLVATGLHLLGQPPAWHPQFVRWWHARLCRILALEITLCGQLSERALVVANHISWLDIPVLGAQGSVGFLSKAEVRRWPVIGWMAAVSGTVFIERGAHRFADAIAALRARIAAGFAVVIFPEGTTSDGTAVRRFLPRLFAVAQPAADTGGGEAEPIRLQPVALRYGSGPQPDTIAPYIDDDTLVCHLWQVLKHPGIAVRVTFLPSIDARGQGRRQLADQARAAILNALERETASNIGRAGHGVNR
ncbi:lysophospholipid acyltransferase family protein [Thiorhodovibrio frisius]|uniref:1-acyl-sn-glycerol-3-phosphate acyltransferase n=1 Tax=Thiorhodovibrio frisius TaxID=631362 RepID=H8Z1C4_9GAMM|nr:lysophospholipid acyltransferase family protein [Thiorhodovibrio frisius]EIC22473.1 1-acyl-sn-glycerol-3-phosphate acyltransferase [Thiorhodovibrio frisius]WPL24774.1 2-acyl-glycerophospho-ethanolamine acyltransferase [Thiorhodovibrio frisius]